MASTEPEKVHEKRFNLMRYFIITSLAALVGVALLTALAFGTLARQILVHEAEENAIDIAHLMAAEFTAELETMSLESIPDRWSDPQVWTQLSATFARSGGALGVVKVKAFDATGQIIYSTDQTLIGQVDSNNPNLQSALGGQISSQLQQAEKVADLSGETFVVDMIETYVPVSMETGSPFSAFEIYQDATGIQEQIRSAQMLVVILMGSATFLLFAILYLIVRRADQTIARQTSQLQTAYAELRQLEQLKANLVHMIVHDMKNPLTAISGYVELLLHVGPLDETQTQHLKIIRINGQRLLSMISNLLDTTRLEEGHLELCREAVPVRQVVEPVVPDLTPLLETRGKTLHLDVADDLPSLWVDRDLVVRVMGNLLSNAEKYVQKGGNIWVTARWGDNPGTLVLCVRDDGEGIPAEYHEAIFEKFGQVRNRQEGRLIGTGLGLTFCKLVVEAHGGTIDLESTVGQGTTFAVTLPAAPDEE